MAASLAEAHRIGLIHRDIKPGNVILVAERGGAPDVAKVVDFGLVQELETDRNMTGRNLIEGTPHYLAPETLSSSAGVGPWTDLYSLGCVGYFLLTGSTVFDGRTAGEVCRHHLHSRPTPPEERIGRPVPETLSTILLACLEKSPALRPASAEALIDRLDGGHDVDPWTNELGRLWWTVRGPHALARVGRQREAVAPAAVSFIRPADTLARSSATTRDAPPASAGRNLARRAETNPPAGVV